MAECMPPSGWQDDKTLSESCRHLLTSRFAADVEFSVGNQQEIVKAHKFILICRSSVFQVSYNNRKEKLVVLLYLMLVHYLVLKIKKKWANMLNFFSVIYRELKII